MAATNWAWYMICFLVALVACLAPILIVFMISRGDRTPKPQDHRSAPCPNCKKLVSLDDQYCSHCAAKMPS